ncbi:hypothetical protein BDZ88DRAFT_431743 [Geranomyces variabilis]|nr:hypothetical protein BDZ88DRAFT_431743 [Geranomyces variabilis]
MHPVVTIGLQVFASVWCILGFFFLSDKDGMQLWAWTIRALWLVQLVPIWWTYWIPATPAVSSA